MQMKSLKYRVKTLSQLLITSNTGDPNMVSTREYISGVTVLGALAGIYIRINKLADAHLDAKFQSWFLSGGLKFTNAYIVSDNDGNPQCNIPLPISVQKDKENENKIYDLLYFDRDELKDDAGNDIITKRIDSFGKIGHGQLYEQRVRKSLNFHHERDTAKGTTKKGMIFNYESMDTGQTFEGAIIGEDGDLKEMAAFFGKSFETSMGRSRSAQYGKVSFDFITPAAEPEVLLMNPANGEAAITFLSDTIIHNRHGFSTTDRKDLENALKEKLGDAVTIEKIFARAEETENFVSVWKLRKPSERCFSMGTSLLVSGSEDAKKLKELQINGLGERTHEGFGRVAVGVQHDELLDKRNYHEGLKKPESISELAKVIAMKAIQNYIRGKVGADALDECAEFKNLPTKSLVARLELAVQSRDHSAFEIYVSGLRKAAKDKLVKCHNNKQNLLEFLQKKKVGKEDIDKYLKTSDMEMICEDIGGCDPKEDDVFMKSLYRSYFEVFFSTMRKAIKAGKED